MAVFRQLSSAFSVMATNNTISVRHVISEMVIAHKNIYSVVQHMNYL
jgi:hypothetical protein